MEITYDPTKNATNIANRGLAFELAKQLDWSSAIIEEDTRKDYGERRFQVLGFIEKRLHAMVFTPRAGKVHVISLRKANAREAKKYEQTSQS